MTLLEINRLIKRCNRLFKSAANAWERGNNSGSGDYLIKMIVKCDRLRHKAESILYPMGIDVDYPGLMPSFQVNGFHFYTVESAVSEAVSVKQKIFRSTFSKPLRKVNKA